MKLLRPLLGRQLASGVSPGEKAQNAIAEDEEKPAADAAEKP